MTRTALVRVTAQHPAFVALTAELDAELHARYGAVQTPYDAFNVLGDLATAMLLADASGFVACGCIRPYDATRVELKRMFVRADRRGRGLAGEVLRGLEAWARELGFATMILETGDRQPEAEALYARHGYQPIAPYPPYVGLAVSRCMAKALWRAGTAAPAAPLTRA